MDAMKRLIKLAKTGKERFVILDESGEGGFVLVPLEEYERLANHTESPDPPPHPEPEHKSYPPPQSDTVKIQVKLGVPPPTSQQSQKFEDEERFYLEPLG
jgi:hypothetical protein